jgi:hypothetical protein
MNSKILSRNRFEEENICQTQQRLEKITGAVLIEIRQKFVEGKN